MLKRRKYVFKADTGLLEAIGNVFFAVKRWASVRIKEFDIGLTFEQLVVLMVLKDEDGVSLGDLSEALDREKTTITRMVDGLERRNLVVRVSSREDRRKKLIYLTSLGKKKLEEIKEFEPIAINEAYKDISDQDMQTTLKVLERVLKNVTRNTP